MARYHVSPQNRGELTSLTRLHYVVIEFDSSEKALECHESPEYKAASELRDTYSENDIIIIEGV